MRKIAVLSLFLCLVAVCRAQYYRKPVYEREAGLYRG